MRVRRFDPAICLSLCEPTQPVACCGGRPRGAWQWPECSVYRTLLLAIAAPSASFFAFVCPDLSRRLSPLVLGFGVGGFLLACLLLLATAFRDPGSIRPPQVDKDAGARARAPTAPLPSLRSPLARASRPTRARAPPRRGAGGRYTVREVLVRGHTLELKFCTACQMHRPLRASHCRECNRCVLKWDHHCARRGAAGRARSSPGCPRLTLPLHPHPPDGLSASSAVCAGPWVGNCIGQGNYRLFLSFVLTAALYTAYVAACCALELAALTREAVAAARSTPPSAASREQYGLRTDTSLGAFAGAVSRCPAALLVGLYALVACLLLLLLCSYHAYLVSINETTNENVKDVYYEGNPFAQSCGRNWAQACCGLRGEEGTELGGAGGEAGAPLEEAGAGVPRRELPLPPAAEPAGCGPAAGAARRQPQPAPAEVELSSVRGQARGGALEGCGAGSPAAERLSRGRRAAEDGGEGRGGSALRRARWGPGEGAGAPPLRGPAARAGRLRTAGGCGEEGADGAHAADGTDSDGPSASLAASTKPLLVQRQPTAGGGSPPLRLSPTRAAARLLSSRPARALGDAEAAEAGDEASDDGSDGPREGRPPAPRRGRGSCGAGSAAAPRGPHRPRSESCHKLLYTELAS